MRCGGSPAISLPRKWIEPAEGGVRPVTVLNRVVLPAPLAPMRPTISPSSTAKLTPRRTSSPPKFLKTPFSCSSGTAISPSVSPSVRLIGQDSQLFQFRLETAQRARIEGRNGLAGGAGRTTHEGHGSFD